MSYLFIYTELYFDMELQQLEAIWADSSTQWNFDFDHRNEIQEAMNNAFNAQAEQIFKMQVTIRIFKFRYKLFGQN
jgi:hypothetical protein